MANILVVDDDDLIRELIEITLREAGHEVRAVVDGITALGDYRTQRPDLVISDLVMPGGEGISLIKAIREEPGYCPILAISGAIHADVFLPESVRLGADLAIGKPFRLDDLVKNVAVLLRKSG
jgi:two-component system, OmpR family, response regulator